MITLHKENTYGKYQMSPATLDKYCWICASDGLVPEIEIARANVCVL